MRLRQDIDFDTKSTFIKMLKTKARELDKHKPDDAILENEAKKQ